MKEYFLDKKKELEEKKLSIGNKDFSAEIEEKVEKYRQEVEAEYEKERLDDLAKIDHYLEFIDEEIRDVEEAERIAEEKARAEAEAVVVADGEEVVVGDGVVSTINL